jgi:HK97 gp10 family phage protein
MADLHWTQVRALVKAGKIIKTPSGSRAKRIYGSFPSKPGQPPHKQVGVLRGSVTYEVGYAANGALTARVGTNIVYGKFLELGTRRMKARPWLKRALNEKRSAIHAILNRPMRMPER